MTGAVVKTKNWNIFHSLQMTNIFIDCNRCGTVMDFVVAMMLDLSEPVTSIQVPNI